MNKFIIICLLLFFAWLSGWRVYPREIINYIPFARHTGERRPIIGVEQTKNIVGRWRPQDVLDNFNGNKEFQRKVREREDKLAEERSEAQN